MPKKKKAEGESMEGFVTQAEAARAKGVDLSVLSQWVQRERVRSRVVFGRRVVFLEDVLNYDPTSNKGGRPRKTDPLSIAEFAELCRVACADLKHRKPSASGDDYLREMCNVIANRRSIEPPTLSNDYHHELIQLADGAGLDEHAASKVARKCVEEAITKKGGKRIANDDKRTN